VCVGGRRRRRLWGLRLVAQPAGAGKQRAGGGKQPAGAARGKESSEAPAARQEARARAPTHAGLRGALFPASPLQARGLAWSEPLLHTHAHALLRGRSGAAAGAAPRPAGGGRGLAGWLEWAPGDEPATENQLAFILKRFARSPGWIAALLRVQAVTEEDLRRLSKRRASALVARLLERMGQVPKK
jgi:hypothetical protein